MVEGTLVELKEDLKNVTAVMKEFFQGQQKIRCIEKYFMIFQSLPQGCDSYQRVMTRVLF